ncbi:MAG: thiol reductant ABC exporter subunit CydC [Bifidobacteriaceae bacterium]|jgi:ATP-binding cassette subfamily C protein CydC|nr:thiol reductant ABC exporter subunit CydC [Bifidobacteriaceae bacterium]
MSRAAAPPVKGETGSAPGRPLRRAIALTGLKAGPLAAAVFFGALTQAASVALAGASAWLIVRASQMPPVLSLQVAVVGVRAFGITRGISRYVERLTAHRVALNGMTNLRVRLYERMAAGSGSGAAAFKRGDVLARVGGDIDDVGDLVVRGIIPALVAAVLIVGSSAAVAAFLPVAGLAVFACLALVAVGGPLATFRAARLSESMASAARADVSASSLGIIENASELRVGGQLANAMAALKAQERRLAAAADAVAKPSAFATSLTEIGSGLALILTLILSGAAWHAGAISATEVAVIVLMPLAAFESVAGLSPAAAQVYKSRAAAARIVALADAGHSAAARPTAKRWLDDQPPTGVLEAKGLAAGWGNGRAVVTGIDLTLAPGQAVGLVGPSGAGKTTLLTALAGLIEPQAGEVAVGAAALFGLTSEARAETVAFIAEDAHIFATTVLENLRVAKGPLTESEAAAVLDQVGLGAWVAGLPDGIDTLLGAGAGSLSGGERRRLLLARALVSPAQYVLLDEPAEHLDADAGRRLTGELIAAARAAGRGLLVVSHQEDTLAQADRVYRLADGVLALARTGGSGAGAERTGDQPPERR